MKKKHITHKSHTDWDQVDKFDDKDIDLSDNPEVTPEMFAKAVLRKRFKPVTRKIPDTFRINSNVPDYVQQKIKRGLNDIESDRILSEIEFDKRMSKWLEP